MKGIKKQLRRFQLALMFALIVFLIMLMTLLVMFMIILILQRFGIQVLNEAARTPLFIFAIVSLGIGTVFAFFLSRIPLRPVHTVCEAADQIAEGDYSVRVHLKGLEEFQQLSDSFNHMAEELGSVEMLRSDFINHFSHEFKTPIVSIRGFAKMLKRDDLSNEERNEYLDIIISESERLSDLSTSILNLSKIEQQSIITNKKKFNLTEQIRIVIAMLYDKWQKKNLTFDFDCGEIYFSGNEEMMKQVWINLLDNAVKFSPVKGIITIRLQRTVSSIVVSIRNEGNILSEESINHMFDKFYQADKSHASSGYGLGLSIVKRIIELHGGTIKAENIDDIGIEFTIDIPNVQN